jgi:hypothetical protein
MRRASPLTIVPSATRGVCFGRVDEACLSPEYCVCPRLAESVLEGLMRPASPLNIVSVHDSQSLLERVDEACLSPEYCVSPGAGR